MSKPTQHTLTALELATLATALTRNNAYKPKDAVEEALTIYKAACEILEGEEPQKDRWKGKEYFLDYLKALVPRFSKNQLREAAIEFRHSSIKPAWEKKFGPLQRKKSEKEIDEWIAGESNWKTGLINWGDDFVRYCAENDVCKIAAQRKRAKDARAKGGRAASASRQRNRLLSVAKTGVGSNKKEREFLETLRRSGENAGDALHKIGIELDSETLRECVRLLNSSFGKNN